MLAINSLKDIQKLHFTGVAGTGMSAIAQYLSASGKTITGSDRCFHPSEKNETQEKLVVEGIQCFLQDGSGINDQTQVVVISTAIEETNVEIQKALSLSIPVMKRAELLSLIVQEKRTIAIGGTSGKSTTSAMLFDILDYAGLEPSIISGAGLVRLQEKGKIGNAQLGKGDLLVIEADESDGSIVNYYPEIGVLLNIDKDHKEISELQSIFLAFRHHCTRFIVNASQGLTSAYSQNRNYDFSSDDAEARYKATSFVQTGLQISFFINHTPFTLHAIGKHNMENVLAAVTVANQLGVSLETCSKSIEKYQGIYRRNQVLGQKNNVWVIDDYAHNPAKVAAAILGVQPLAKKVIAWFQPHGYGPTRFLKNDFIEAISHALRPQDEIWMSEIFYAGGTAVKDISANDLIEVIKITHENAFFVEDRNNLLASVRPHLTDDCVLLLMGARDPSLDTFAKSIFENL